MRPKSWTLRSNTRLRSGGAGSRKLLRMLETNPLRRRRGLELAVLAVALAACLLPFATKAYHIDDTLFVWAAQHIREHPFDFYGFDVHWYATWEPMSRVTQNPPAACYYLALAGSMFGWGEVA